MTSSSHTDRLGQDEIWNVNPILVSESRGDLVESIHRGAFAVADPGGRVVAALGDIGRKIYPRSAIKLIQALPMVESGAAEAAGLGTVELALACASHSGERRHVAAIQAWLARIGCKDADLVCGPHPPIDAPSAEALIREGRKPSRVHNNCSGKHTGFLTLAKFLGAPIKGYSAPDHPVQRAVAAALSDLSGISQSAFEVGVDGCGAPNFALPLGSLATAFARIADPSALPPQRAGAIERLKSAVKAEPYFLAGTGRLCTRIVQSGANVIPKVGAQGVYVAALPGLKLGLALKIDDGAGEAAQCLIVALLKALGAIAPDAMLAREFISQPILNTEGKTIGQRRADVALIEEALAQAKV